MDFAGGVRRSEVGRPVHEVQGRCEQIPHRRYGEQRAERVAEHVDQLWKTKRLKRPTLYRRLNDWLAKEVHIGEADIEMCRKIIAIPLELLAPKASDRKRKSRLTRAAFRHAHQRAEEPAPWRAVMDRTSSEDADMDDVEKRAKEIIDEYGDLTTGEEAQIQEFKQAVQDFLKNGPGMPQQRRQALLKHMTGWAPQFKDFLVSPN